MIKYCGRSTTYVPHTDGRIILQGEYIVRGNAMLVDFRVETFADVCDSDFQDYLGMIVTKLAKMDEKY